MPIYEYRCDACGKVTAHLVRNAAEAMPPSCEACASLQTRRVMSRFTHHRSEASRLADFEPGAARGPDFYKDSRNVGLWAKKRAQEMGVDLGSQFEATVEKARTGNILEES
jgi:putative FmdB family regulatory protein